MDDKSRDAMQRMLAHISTYPAAFWDRWSDAYESGASKDTCKRLEREAYRAEAWVRSETDRVRGQFERGESWAE